MLPPWLARATETRAPIRLSPDSRDLYNDGAMQKRAAQRLARYFRSLGHRVKLKRHRSPAGAFYSLEFLVPTRQEMP